MSREQLIRRIFKRYYKTVKLPSIAEIERREFAFVPLENPDIMVRHRSFPSLEQLEAFLRANPPLHAYYSTALYEWPEARNMDEKGWLGADLVFDIDIDHIPTECKEEHDRWKCLDCGASGRGMPPETCPQCGGRRIDREIWVCDRCLERAKELTLKLVEDFLIPDFGFSAQEITIVFSGHRGFHVHIEREDVRSLDQDARREIVDYIKGLSLRLEKDRLKQDRLAWPDMSDPGWRGRITRGIYELLLSADEDTLIREGIRPRDARYLVEHRAEIARDLEKRPSRWSGLLRLSRASWEALIRAAARRQGVEIDERVTTDTKRLIRLPGSLHGKTGLRVCIVDLSRIDDFNPFVDARALDGELRVRVTGRLPQLTLGGERISAREGDVLKVPLAIGLYVVLRGAGEPLGWA